MNQGHTHTEGFGLPDGYFADAAASIAARIEWEDEHRQYPRLLEVKRELPFRAPTEYFENEPLEMTGYPFLASNVLQHPLGGFQVPPGYLKKGLQPGRQARIITLPRMLRAAAALVAVAGAAYLVRSPEPATSSVDCETIACAGSDELLRSPLLEGADDEELFELVNPAALESALQDPAQQKPFRDTSHGNHRTGT